MRNFLRSPYCISFGIILFFGLAFIFETSSLGFKVVANDIYKDFKAADSTRDSIVIAHSTFNSCTKALSNQYVYLKRLKAQHVEMARIFEIFYYSFVTILVFATVAAAILIALIARSGWDSQSKQVKAAFIGFFFTASLTAVLINVFNNSQNASNNIDKYFYLTNLQTNIYEALAADTLLDQKCKDSTLLRVFWDNNKNLKDNLNLFIDIKADKIPATPDISKILGGNNN